MEFVRIGDKIISKEKLRTQIEKILDLRVKGISQREVAKQLSLDRAFVSRLESLGEVRKGSRIAVVGFPVLNKTELENMLEQEGVEFFFILTEQERWDFVDEGTGLQLFNKVIDLMTKLKNFDYLIVLASNTRIKLFKSIFDNEVIGVEIGRSPIEEDKMVELNIVRSIIHMIRGLSCRGAK
ncbi:MAG: transcriptional regulator [Bacillota bacterium]|jgi:transcriptional regulator with XRE-family HTH domain